MVYDPTRQTPTNPLNATIAAQYAQPSATGMMPARQPPQTQPVLKQAQRPITTSVPPAPQPVGTRPTTPPVARQPFTPQAAVDQATAAAGKLAQQGFTLPPDAGFAASPADAIAGQQQARNDEIMTANGLPPATTSEPPDDFGEAWDWFAKMEEQFAEYGIPMPEGLQERMQAIQAQIAQRRARRLARQQEREAARAARMADVNGRVDTLRQQSAEAQAQAQAAREQAIAERQRLAQGG